MTHTRNVRVNTVLLYLHEHGFGHGHGFGNFCAERDEQHGRHTGQMKQKWDGGQPRLLQHRPAAGAGAGVSARAIRAAGRVWGPTFAWMSAFSASHIYDEFRSTK